MGLETLKRMNRRSLVEFEKFHASIPSVGSSSIAIPSLKAIAYQAVVDGCSEQPGLLRKIKFQIVVPCEIVQEAKAVRTAWEKFCKQILKISHRFDADLFGGFVRDWGIRGEIPSDMDFKIKNFEKMTSFILALQNKFDVSCPTNRFEGRTYGAVKIRVVDRKNGVGIWVDMSLGEPNFDFAENSLIMYTWNNICYPNWCTTIRQQAQLHSNIMEKIMTPLDEHGNPMVVHSVKDDCLRSCIIKQRIDKFKARGWTILGLGECEIHGACDLATDELRKEYNDYIQQHWSKYIQDHDNTMRAALKKEKADYVVKESIEFEKTQREFPDSKQLRQAKFDQRKKFQKTKTEKHKLRHSNKR